MKIFADSATAFIAERPDAAPRQLAWAAFEVAGLPTTDDEVWRYAPLKDFDLDNFDVVSRAHHARRFGLRRPALRTRRTGRARGRRLLRQTRCRPRWRRGRGRRVGPVAGRNDVRRTLRERHLRGAQRRARPGDDGDSRRGRGERRRAHRGPQRLELHGVVLAHADRVGARRQRDHRRVFRGRRRRPGRAAQ